MKQQKETFLAVEWTGSFAKISIGEVNGGIETLQVIRVFHIQEVQPLLLPEVILEIKELLKEYAHIERRILILERQEFIIRYLDLPSDDRIEIASMLILQIEKQLPYSLDEMYYDFSIFPSKKEGFSHVVLAAIHCKKIDSVLSVLHSCEFYPCVITCSSWGLFSAYRHASLTDAQRRKTVLLLDRDFNETQCMIVKNMRLVYTRGIMHHAIDVDDNAYAQSISNDIQQTIDMLCAEKKIDAIDEVVFGNGMEGLIADVRTVLGEQIPFTVLPLCVISEDHADQALIKSHALSFASLAGVGYSDIPYAINLLPETERALLRKKETADERKFLGILCMLLLCVLVVGGSLQLYERYRYIKGIEERLVSLDPAAQKVADILRKMRVINIRKKSQRIPLTILSELYAQVPHNMYLTRFVYDEATAFSIRGIAKTISQASDLLLALQKTVYFKNAEMKFARQQVIQGKELVDFEIVCPLEEEEDL